MSTDSNEGKTGLSGGSKLAIVLLLVAAVLGVVYMKAERNAETTTDPAEAQQNPTARAQPSSTTQPHPSDKPLPRLVDLGAGKCKACKMMEPVIDELRREYRGKLDVVFIDVWKDKQAAEKYDIQLIPTQVFLDPSGKELFRHQGFLGKEDILTKWKELGFDLGEKATETTGG